MVCTALTCACCSSLQLATAHHLLHKGQVPQLPEHDPVAAITSKRQKLKQDPAEHGLSTAGQDAAAELQSVAVQVG